MSTLVERYHMDTQHLLQAEADVNQLSRHTLAALAGSRSLEDILYRLQQGELFYCTDHPQRPYCVYFRGKHYINPAAQSVATPRAIEQLRSRYAFMQIADSASPIAVHHGAGIRQYYTTEHPQEPPVSLPEPTPNPAAPTTIGTINIQVETHYDIPIHKGWNDTCQLWSIDDGGSRYQQRIPLRQASHVKREAHIITVTFEDVIPKHHYSCIIDQGDGQTISLFQHLLITRAMAIPPG